MDQHTKKCVFRPSRCEYCGAETALNHLQVSLDNEWVNSECVCNCKTSTYTLSYLHPSQDENNIKTQNFTVFVILA